MKSLDSKNVIYFKIINDVLKNVDNVSGSILLIVLILLSS